MWIWRGDLFAEFAVAEGDGDLENEEKYTPHLI